MPSPARASVTRRGVLLAGAGIVLAGCDVRLEDDAPHIPLVPTREPVPAETALVALVAECRVLRDAAATATGPRSAALVDVHARQAATLAAALRARGVPDRLLTAAGTPPPPTSTGTSSPSSASPPATPAPSPSAAAAALAHLELRGLAGLDRYAAVEAALAPTLLAILAQHRSAATMLGAPSDVSGGSAGNWQSWHQPTALAPLILATWRAAYLIEVAAAHLTKAPRARAMQTLGDLQSLLFSLRGAAGASAPPPPVGQVLPRPVRTEADAAVLASQATASLRSAYASALPALWSGDRAAVLARVPWWLGAADVAAMRWGAAMTPFPGLAL